jgi:NAD(P)-dependent dehydrogenase (short-subunit alcohol dehydrogenase family)
MRDTSGIQGRHALVTGAGRGIGREIVRTLAAAGAGVTLLGRKREALEEAASALAGKNAVVTADVTDPGGLERAVRAAEAVLGPVDILVNNAGIARSAPFAKLDPGHWDQVIGINLSGVYHATRLVLPSMAERGFGRVVNIASTAALRGYPYIAAYCASKHGLIGLTRALAIEFAKSGVTVNAVCPGYTETDMLDDTLANIEAKTGRSREEARRILQRFNPQERFVQPEEVADAVLWLCRPESASITGQAIGVAGGEVM